MSRTRFGIIALVLFGLGMILLGTAGSSRADKLPSQSSYCRPGAKRTQTDVGTYLTIPRNGRELHGTFPPSAGGQTGGVSFDLLNGDGTIVVAFQEIVISPGHANVRQYFGFGRPDTRTMSTVTEFFDQLNRCIAGDGRIEISGYFSNFGYSWVCNPEDLFRLDETGLTSDCKGDTDSPVRRLELLLDIYVLDDGRLVCVTSLERPSTPAPTPGPGSLESIIWVLDRTGGRLLVDATIGGIEWELPASNLIPIEPISTPS